MSAEQATTPLVYSGEMTIYSAAANYQQLKERLNARAPMRLDLSGVTEIDSAGLQLLLFAQAEADALGLEFAIMAHSDPVEDVLALLFLKRTFGLPTGPRAEKHA